MKRPVKQILVYDDLEKYLSGELVLLDEGTTHVVTVDGTEHEIDASDANWDKILRMPLAEVLQVAGYIRRKAGRRPGPQESGGGMTARRDRRERQRNCLDAAGINYKNPGRGFRYTRQADRVFAGAEAAGLLDDEGRPRPGVTREDLLHCDTEDALFN